MRISKIDWFIGCFILLISHVSLNAQKPTTVSDTSDSDTTFSIQFFASKFQSKSFSDISKLGHVIREKIPGQEIYRYRIGSFNSRKAASALLNAMIESGYSDAFLVPATNLSSTIKESVPENELILVEQPSSRNDTLHELKGQQIDPKPDLPGELANENQKIEYVSSEIQPITFLYTGKSLGVLGKTRFQEEHERVTDYAIKHDLEFKLVSHACWRAKGLTIFMPSDEPLGHELNLILEIKDFWEIQDSIPALVTNNVLLFQDPKRMDLDMLQIFRDNERTERQFPEVEQAYIRLYTCKIEDDKKCMIIEEESAVWPESSEFWETGEINRVDFGKIARLFELPYNQGNFGSRSTLLKGLEKRGTMKTRRIIKLDLGHRNGDFDLAQADRARVDFSGLNSLGYEIALPFENELSLPLDTLKSIASKFSLIQLVATNIEVEQEDIFSSHLVIDHQNLRIGFLGMVDPSLAVNLSGQHLKHIEFKDPVGSAQKEVDKLYKKEVDVIVALSNMSRGDNSILAENVKGIDLILANLTGNGTPFLRNRNIEIPKGVKRGQGHPYLISTNYDYGIAVGEVGLEFRKDPETGYVGLSSIKEELHPVNDKILSDSTLMSQLTSGLDRVRRPKGDLMFPAFVDIIEQEMDLEDYDEITKHGRTSKALWEQFIANLLRRGAPAELAIIRQVPSFLPLIGKLHEREVRSWLWIEDHIVMMDVKGRDIKRLLSSNRSQHLVTSGLESFRTSQGKGYMIMGRQLIDDVYYRVATTNVISNGALEEYFRFALRVNDQFIIDSGGNLKVDGNAGNVGLRDYILTELKRIRSFGKGKEHHKRIASLLIPETPYERLFTFEFVRPTLWSSINRSYKNEGYESVPESRIISNNSFVIGAEGGLLMTMDGQRSAWDLGFHFAFAQQSAKTEDGITQKTETMDDINVNLTYRFKGKTRNAFHPFARLEYDSEFTPTFNSTTEFDNPRQSVLRGVLGMTKGFSPKWPKLEFGMTAENDFSNDHYQYGVQGRSIGRFPLDKDWRVIYTMTNNFNYYFPTADDTERELSFKYNMVHEVLVPLFGDLSLSVAADLLIYRGKTDINRDPGFNTLIRVGLTYNRLWKPRFQSLF